jgi:hypothetical protein
VAIFYYFLDRKPAAEYYQQGGGCTAKNSQQPKTERMTLRLYQEDSIDIVSRLPIKHYRGRDEIGKIRFVPNCGNFKHPFAVVT